jgi:hypothetical protein
MPIVVVRQRKAWRRRDGVFLYFEVRDVNILSSRPDSQSAFSPGQRRRYRQPEGRDEGFRHHWPGGEGVCTCSPLSHSRTSTEHDAQADLWPRIASNAGTVV